MKALDSNKMPFHDAELIGVNHDRENKTVLLSFCLADGSKQSLTLEQVISIKLNDFIDQNVVSRIWDSRTRKMNDESVNASLEWLFAHADGSLFIKRSAMLEMQTRLKNGELWLICLEPSWGAELVCLCGDS